MCEPSVMIAVSSVHRKEAIEATSYAIDAIKSSVAVWKKVNLLYIMIIELLCILHRRCMQKVRGSGKRTMNIDKPLILMTFIIVALIHFGACAIANHESLSASQYTHCNNNYYKNAPLGYSARTLCDLLCSALALLYCEKCLPTS